MTTTNFIADLFTPAGFYLFIEVGIIFVILLYILFAFVVVKQVNLMNTSFKTSMAFLFSFISYVHFFASILLLVIALFVFF